MPEEYYGFAEKPFGLTADPTYFYKSESHANALDQLQYAIRRREGFVVVTGDVGTGKTTLCRALFEQLDRKTFTALVVNPFIGEEDLLRMILEGFGIVSRSEIKRGRLARVSRQELIDTLNEFLLSLLALGAGALLVVDEAQNLPLPVLEQIRILSNLETNKEKLLQIVLVGQLNLKDLLRSPDLRQLDQRVSMRCELKPLTAGETAAYVAHRLAIAAGGTVVSFAPEGLERVHKYTGGIPRLINMVCDRALLAGQAASTNRITPDIVTTAATGMELVPAPTSIVRSFRERAAAYAAAALVAAVAAVTWYGVVTLQARSASRPAEPQVRQVTRPAVPATNPGGAAGPAAPDPAAQPTATSGSTSSTRSAHGLPGSPAAPISTETAPAGGGTYSVLVGSFRQDSEAAALLDQLGDLGYRGRAVRVESELRGTWHQVLVGPYADVNLARENLARVRQLPGYADARLTTR